DLHFMNQLVGIAALDASERSLGHGRFQMQDGLSVLLSGGRTVADKLEYSLHMLKIALARFLRLGVVFNVVVAIGHGEAALIHVGDYTLGIVRVLRRASRKKQGSAIGIPVVDKLQPRHERSKFFR